MKTTEDMKENAGLVRDIIALCGIDFPADDFERDLRDAMFRKAFAIAPSMDIVHLRRINEALCDMEYPTEAALGLRRQVLVGIAKVHGLREYRSVRMPVIRPPAKGEKGKAAA